MAYRPYSIPEVFITTPPRDHLEKSLYIKHVELRGKLVHRFTYERLQNSLLSKYLISTRGPQITDRLMTISFKQEKRKEPDYSKEVLQRGVEFSGAMFRFLGNSNSQLKDKTCYLMEDSDEDIHNLLAQFADFSKISSIAKRAKRIGLLFSGFNKSITLNEGEYEVIEDIQQNQYNFTDGCGFMSEDVAKEIKRVHRLDHVPSVVQIRYQGYKGVLVHLPELQYLKVQFRNSMKKFTIPNDEVRRNCSTFGVVEYSKPYSNAFLNTQLTMILADNGTSHDYLLKLQGEFFRMLDNLCSNEEAALRYLTVTGHTKTLQRLQDKSIDNLQVQQELTGLRNEEIKNMLKDNENSPSNQNQAGRRVSKLRVLVPKARVVFGVCDPYGELEYGEVFFNPSLPEGDIQLEFSNAKHIVVARNPCYHPGDVRVLKLAQDKRRYVHLFDCIVFPTKGPRPHPDECSGGDLDGDKFFVSWDQLLIPEWIANPFQFSEEQAVDPYCFVEKTGMFSPVSKSLKSFGRAHFPRLFGTEEQATLKKNIRSREELLNYFASFNNNLVSRIDRIFMKYASRYGPSCEICVTLNEYFSDALSGVANNDVVEKQLEEFENNYRREERANLTENNQDSHRKELIFPRLVRPSRLIVRRRQEPQFWRDLISSKKAPFEDGDGVWTIMEKQSEKFVKEMTTKYLLGP